MARQNARIKKTYHSGGQSGTEYINIVNQEIRVGQIQRGNASIQKWINALKHAEQLINPNRKNLIELIHDVSIDPFVSNLIDKRTGAIQLSPYVWHGLDNEQIIDNFESPWFVEFLGQVMDHTYRGHQLVQFNFKDGFIHDTEPIPRQNVKPEKKLITFEMYGETGFRYDEDPYDKYILEIGKPKDFGIMAKVVPYSLMIRDNLAFFMTHNEMFGMPFRVYKYKPNDPSSRQQTIEQAEKHGAAAYIVMPDTTSVDFHQANSASSASSPYQLLHRVLREEITISFLGQTLTTNTEGKGSNALGRIHKDVEESINLMDMLKVEMILNYKFKKNILIPHGYPMEGVKGSFTKTQRLSQEEKLKIWDTIGQYHAPIDFEAWYDEFGVPHPEDQTSIDRFMKRDNGKAVNKQELSNQKKKMIQLYELYGRYPITGVLELSNGKKLEKAWERVMKLIHEGRMSAGDVDPEIYELIATDLWKGARSGYAEVASEIDEDMLKALRQNVYVFSGFKTYQELQDATKLLYNETGEIKALSEFIKDVQQIYDQYNVNWLTSEYNMAVANAQAAAKWQRIEAEKSDLPFLQYSSINDSVARHTQYDKITRRVDDPIWDYLTPPLDWGCRCTVRQLPEAEETPANKIPNQQIIKDQFAFNPGKQKVIFPKNHPYFKVQSAHAAAAENFWNLKLPEGDV